MWNRWKLAAPSLFVALAAHAEPPAPALDLQALLDEAEAASPEIQAALLRKSAADQAASQAEALPDPLLTTSFTNVGFSGITLGEDENANFSIAWIQDVPAGGKRRLAGEVARAQDSIAERSVELMRLQVAARIKSIYAELHRIERNRIVLEDSAHLLDSLVDTARVRYESGAGTLESVLKASTERTRLDAERAVLVQERRSTEIELLAVLGRDEDGTFPPATVALTGAPADSAALEAVAIARSPQLAMLRAVTSREEARVALARKSMQPDYMWGASYGYRGDLDPMVQGMFGVRLPLFRQAKQNAAATQADFERQASLRDTGAAEREVRARVRDLIARADRAASLARIYDEGILPQARSALDAAAAAYAVGRTDFTTLIDDFLKTLRYEVESEAQKADRFKSLAALEPLTGEQLVSAGNP